MFEDELEISFEKLSITPKKIERYVLVEKESVYFRKDSIFQETSFLIRWLSKDDLKKAVIYSLELIQLFKILEKKTYINNSYLKSLVKTDDEFIANFLIQRGKNSEDSMNLELNYCFITTLLEKNLVTKEEKIELNVFKNYIEGKLIIMAKKGWKHVEKVYIDLIEWIISKIQQDKTLLDVYIKYTKEKNSYNLLRCFISTSDNQKILSDYSKGKTFKVLKKTLDSNKFGEMESIKAEYFINDNGKNQIIDKFNYIYYINHEDSSIKQRTRVESENEYCIIGMDINKVYNLDQFISNFYGIQVFETEKDGNCLFRSCSNQLELNHEKLRSILYQLFLDYKDIYLEKYPDFLSYVENMKNDGEWGGDLEIIETSKFFDRPIYLFQYNGVFRIYKDEIKFYKHQDFLNKQNPNENPIILIYDGSHYNWGKYQSKQE